MPWHTIIDQANAAAESNGRFFLQNESIRPKQISKSECSTVYNISQYCCFNISPSSSLVFVYIELYKECELQLR